MTWKRRRRVWLPAALLIVGFMGAPGVAADSIEECIIHWDDFRESHGCYSIEWVGEDYYESLDEASELDPVGYLATVRLDICAREPTCARNLPGIVVHPTPNACEPYEEVAQVTCTVESTFPVRPVSPVLDSNICVQTGYMSVHASDQEGSPGITGIPVAVPCATG